MEEMRDAYKVFVRKTYGRDQLGDLGVDGKKILKYVSEKLGVKLKREFNWLRIIDLFTGEVS
jgi:hypothetical protein